MTLSSPVPAKAKAKRAGMMPSAVARNESAQPHAGESRHQIDQKERKGRHQPQEQQIAEGIVAEALAPAWRRAGRRAEQRLAERGARHQEDDGRAERWRR